MRITIFTGARRMALWVATDPAALLRSVFAAVKPGGVVVIEDHVANANNDVTQTVNDLHRIDPGCREARFRSCRVSSSTRRAMR